MPSRSRHDETGTRVGAGSANRDRAAVRPCGPGPVPRVRSGDLLRNGAQLIIEHAGREYRLRVTSNGKLILTA